MAYSKDQGTNFGVASTSSLTHYFKDNSGNWIFITYAGSPTSALSAATGYAVGCLCVDTTNAYLYINTGTASSATFSTKATFS